MNQFLVKNKEKSLYDETGFLNFLVEEQTDQEGVFQVEDYLNSRE
jgi:hypothetical protein